MNRSLTTSLVSITMAALAVGANAFAATGGGANAATRETTSPTPQRGALPQPQPTFHGKIAVTAEDSKPDFPKPVQAPKGAPNILLIITDDVGYGASSTFGGPIATPAFDRVAKAGLRFTEFHTTALCSPTRAALITGRNHHSCGVGVVMEQATGFPGYNTVMPKSCGTIGQILRANGYSTAWFGKNHNVPDWQNSLSGPFDLWPNRLGFDYFYGFIGGDTNQWHPALVENNSPVEPPYHDPNYILDKDLADHAIQWITEQKALSPDRPFFIYYATGTAHAPHHAPPDWIARYKGQFDQGWDRVREQTLERQKQLGVVPANTRLTERSRGIPAWNSLSRVQQRLYAHMMEVYAAALSYADMNIGRVLDAVEKTGELDNTVVVYIMGDNGASFEGSLQGSTNELATMTGIQEPLPFQMQLMGQLGSDRTYNHYPVGWAHAMDTPFQWGKQVASHWGGTRNGMAIAFSPRIHDPGGIRSQFHHVIDLMPTLLELAHIPAPAKLDGIDQKPIEGTSLAYTFAEPKAPSHRTTQYFEMLGNRALYDRGWVAATTPARPPWVTIGASPDPMRFQWELYDVADDYSESMNVAAQFPDKLRTLQQKFMVEAKKYNVLPLDTRLAERGDPALRPSLTTNRTEFTYNRPMKRIPEGVAPDTKNRSYEIIADVEVREQASGVLATIGGRFGGWALLLEGGRPRFIYALTNQPELQWRIGSGEPIPAGHHRIEYAFQYDGGGMGKGGTGMLSVDGQEVARGRIERTVAVRYSITESFDVGQDTGTPVADDYEQQMPFAFNGRLNSLTIHLEPKTAGMGVGGAGQQNRPGLKE